MEPLSFFGYEVRPNVIGKTYAAAGTALNIQRACLSGPLKKNESVKLFVRVVTDPDNQTVEDVSKFCIAVFSSGNESTNVGLSFACDEHPYFSIEGDVPVHVTGYYSYNGTGLDYDIDEEGGEVAGEGEEVGEDSDDDDYVQSDESSGEDNLTEEQIAQLQHLYSLLEDGTDDEKRIAIDQLQQILGSDSDSSSSSDELEGVGNEKTQDFPVDRTVFESASDTDSELERMMREKELTAEESDEDKFVGQSELAQLKQLEEQEASSSSSDDEEMIQKLLQSRAQPSEEQEKPKKSTPNKSTPNKSTPNKSTPKKNHQNQNGNQKRTPNSHNKRKRKGQRGSAQKRRKVQ